MSENRRPASDQPTTIVIDAYRIKLEVPPSDLGERAPATWADVRDQVRQHLIRIAAAPTRLVAEVLEAATRLVRGVSGLPAATADRLRQGHQRADVEEYERQTMARNEAVRIASSGTNDVALPEASHVRSGEAIEKIDLLLKKYRDLGIDAYLIVEPDGRIIVVVGAEPEYSRHITRGLEQRRSSLPPTEDAFR
jgi:hypothetical protein